MKDIKDVGLNRLPPQNLEAEQALLGAILLDNEAMVVEEIISVDDFYKGSHRKIFTAMQELTAENKGVDLVTLSEKLKANDALEEVGGISYLNSLANITPTAANAKYHAEIIKQKAVSRGLLMAATEIATSVYDDGDDVALCVSKAQKLVNGIAEKLGTKDTMKSLVVDDGELMDHIQFSCETPFKELNDAIGVFSARNLIVVGGRAGMGKTSFELTLLRHAVFEEGLPVAYIGSSNHKEIDTTLRLISSIAKVSLKDLKRGRSTGDDLARIKAANEKINKARELIFTKFESKLNVLSIPPMIRALQKKIDRLGLIIIENLQDIIWPERMRTNKDKMDNVLDTLRAFENEIKVPMIVSSQINRTVEDGEDNRPKLSDLKGSGNIEDLADIVLLLHRLQYHEKTANGLPEDGEIIIAKGGPATTVSLKFNGDYLCWEDK